MASVTFDRFDGGLLLARPSSVAPANSLAQLFNMDVQPGGWLRSRPTWRKAVLYAGGNLNLSPGNVHGLESNGGYLWAFALGKNSLPAGHASDTAAGRAYQLDADGGAFLVAGAFLATSPDLATLKGVTPWDTGFVAVLRNDTASTNHKAMFGATLIGTIPQATRTDIADVNMPNSGIMVTAQNRIYAISDDGKTVKFSAVGSATDWTTANNAGSLPVAQHFGSGQKALGLGMYQGKLAVFSDQSIQLWTIDPNPTAMAIDNVVNGIGTRHHRSIVSLNGDLLFLSDTGIRSLTTLQNSLFPNDVDVGLPVNPITVPTVYAQSALALGAAPFRQYWVAAPDKWTVGGAGEFGWLAWSQSRQAKLNAWAWHGTGTTDTGNSREQVKAWATLGSRVFMRTQSLAVTSLLVMTADSYALEESSAGTQAPCSVKTQWLDFGKPGKRKSITGIDFDGKNVSSISILVSVGGDRDGVVADTIAVGSSQSGWTYSGELLPANADGTEFRIAFNGGGLVETQINRFTIHFEEVE